MDPVQIIPPSLDDTPLSGAQKLVASLYSIAAGVNILIAAETAQNLPPVAAFTLTQPSGTSVAVDGTGSSDPDGTVAAYSWDWGDQTKVGSGVTATHTYAAAGTYTVTLTVTDDSGLTDTATRSVTISTVTPPGGGGGTNGFTNDDGGTGVTPSGAGFVTYNPSGSDLQTQLAGVPGGQKLALPAGTIARLKGFTTVASSNGLVNTAGAKLIGSGSAHTILEQPANASSGAVAPTSGTNAHNLLRLEGTGTLLQDLQIKGTPQQIPYYNGVMQKGASPTLTRVKLVAAAPGNDKAPPGETFGLNWFSGSGGQATDCEIDGGGTGASAFATNSWSGGPVWTRCYVHDSPNSGAWALWQTTRDSSGYSAKIVDCAADRDRVFFNIERVDGIVQIVRFRFGTLQHSASVPAGADVVGETNVSSGQYGADTFLVQIIDPLDITGKPLDPTKRPIYVSWFSHGYGSSTTPNYYGTRNVQVLVGGVDKTSSYIKWGGKGAG